MTKVGSNIRLIYRALFLSVVLMMAGCGATPQASPQPGKTVSPSPTLSSNSDLETNNVPEASLKWRSKPGDFIEDPPVASGDRIYVTVVDSCLCALDRETGDILWEFPIGGVQQSAPTLSGDTILFASAKTTAISPDILHDGYIYAVDAKTGSQIWSYKAEEEQVTSPLVEDGVVYFGTGQWAGRVGGYRDEPNGAIYAVSLATGELIWRLPLPEKDIWTDMALENGVLYYMDRVEYRAGRGRLHAMDVATQQDKWALERTDELGDAFTLAQGSLYVTSDETLVAIDGASGKTKWTFKLGDAKSGHAIVAARASRLSCCSRKGLIPTDADMPAPASIEASLVMTSIFIPSPGLRTSPAVADGTVFIGAGIDTGIAAQYGTVIEDHIVALDLEMGKEKWRINLREQSLSNPATPYIADGTLYMATFRPDALYALDANTGATKWRFLADDAIFAPPSVADGVVYIGDYGGNFYALVPPK
ncbi:MAG: PQQ-binding-like beta-propeller repeat protein [Chloroflexia bacterium]